MCFGNFVGKISGFHMHSSQWVGHSLINAHFRTKKPFGKSDIGWGELTPFSFDTATPSVCIRKITIHLGFFCPRGACLFFFLRFIIVYVSNTAELDF